MAKLSLIEIVQDILSDMGDDFVNSISDTDVAMQVAQIVNSTFDEMIANKNWPHLRKLGMLNSSTDNSIPTHMKVPENIKELVSIQYDKRKATQTKPNYQEVKYLDSDNFLRVTNTRNADKAEVDIITDISGAKLLIKNDVAPSYWTSFDDEWIVFDAYDSDVDSTLQATKTQALYFYTPTFSMVDEYVPELPVEAFPALLAEAKSVAFNRIKQAPDGKAEQQSTRQRAWLSRKAWQTAGGIKFPNYGRK